MAPSQQRRLQKHNLRPTLGAPQRYDGVDERQSQQAGRSSTHLNAQASAQTIREASRTSSRDGRTSPPESLNLAGSQQQSDVRLSSPARQQQDGTRSPYAPAVPSPLNQSPSISSVEQRSRKSSAESAGKAEPPASPQHLERHLATATSAILARSQTPVKPHLRIPGLPQMDSLSTLSHSTPRNVHELGSDYSRYPNPFATRSNSANTSQQDLSALTVQTPTFSSSSHLAPSNAVSSSDLAKRLSNPFKDERRLSASMASEDITTVEIAPDSPQPEPRNDEKNERPVSAAAADPVRRAGTPAFIHNADPEKVPFFWLDDRLSAPCAFPLYVDQQEEDDDMHMPKWDDDKQFKPTFKDRFSRANIVNTIGVIFLITGLFTIFVVLPVVSFTGTSLIPYTYDTPLDQMYGYGDDSEAWAHVNDNSYPLIQNVRSGLIDPDTPDSAMKKTGIDGHDLVLVFSDEFNAKNRTFYPGDDPYWFAPDMWYGATQDLEWYDPDAANTGS